VRNKSSDDYTESVALERNAAGEITKTIGIGGEEELTELQYARLSEFAELELIGKKDKTNDKPKAADEESEARRKAD